MNELFQDGLDQLGKMPHQVWVLVGMTFFGVAWKKSQLPNSIFKWVNMFLPIVVYPALELSLSNVPYQQYRVPLVALALWGAAISAASIVMHEGIVLAIKKLFPWVKWPEDTDTKPPV